MTNENEAVIGSDFYGFREGKFNWCIHVIEHWVDSRERYQNVKKSDRLDGTDETFMRIYLTRETDYWKCISHLVRHIQSYFSVSQNWYELKMYKGNTHNLWCRIILRPNGENDWEEDLLNAEKNRSALH